MTNAERIKALETRVKALELRGADTQLAKLSDDPPTMQHAFAIRRVLELAAPMARSLLDSPDAALREAAGEVLSWLDAMR